MKTNVFELNASFEEGYVVPCKCGRNLVDSIIGMIVADSFRCRYCGERWSILVRPTIRKEARLAIDENGKVVQL